MQFPSASALEITLSMLDETNEKIIEESFNKVLVEESKTDDLYAMVEKNILKLISKNQELSKDYFNLLSSLRKLEKCADRATSIANLIVFAYIGGELNSCCKTRFPKNNCFNVRVYSHNGSYEDDF
jgi:phosphate transport system protein